MADANTKLLLHFNGADAGTTFTDSSPSGHTVTAVGNAQLDTANKKFGSASGLFDGSGDYLTIPDHADWDFGTGDFTVDFWAWWDATGGNYFIISRGGDPSNNFNIFHSANAFYTYHMNSVVVNGAAFTPTLDTWYHIAYVRSGTAVNLYVNGTSIGSATNSTDITDTNGIVIAFRSGVTEFPGQLDEFRISNVARWTANFTPPSAEYDAVTSVPKMMMMGVG